jgi:hypothetical protein
MILALHSTWLPEFLFGVPVKNIALLKFRKMGMKWGV